MNETGTPDKAPLMVVALCGSLRRHSATRQALLIALEGAREVGAEVKLLDLREYELAFCGEGNGESDYPADVFRLRREVSEAQGILLGTPEYHGSFSGVLKNALDLLQPEHLQGKVIGLVGVAGGALGATNALGGLRTIGRALHAWVVPQQVSVSEAHRAFTESGRPRDPAIERRLKDLGRRVAGFAGLHASAKAREFLQAWEESGA